MTENRLLKHYNCHNVMILMPIRFEFIFLINKCHVRQVRPQNKSPRVESRSYKYFLKER